MLPTRELHGTGVVTTALGFGCAGLFRLPWRSARRRVLDVAYDAGIRHFDVAPMYGLGLAEAELGQFLQKRRANVTITTKFGIDPRLLTRGVAVLQAPLRAFLAKQANVNARLKESGRGPNSGSFGQLLYSSPGYSRKSAEVALERSLHSLKTDWIDVFLLHDPMGIPVTDAPELVDYLDEQCRQGRIRSWGVTGQASELPEVLRRLGRAPVIQYRDDLFEDPRPIGADLMPDVSSITYGALARALPILRQFFARSPEVLEVWSERLGADLAEESNLPRMLLSIALWRNTAGPVLYTTTRPDRGYTAAEAAVQSITLTDAQAVAFNGLAAEARLAIPEMMKTA